MKKIEITIEGVSPLLMHNVESADLTGGARRRTKKYDLKKEAKKNAYWLDEKKKELCVPARCIYGMILKSATYFKVKGRSLAPIIAGAIDVEPERIGLGTKKYEVDVRPVVIQRQRILRARPKLNKWKITFFIIFNEKYVEEDLIKSIIDEGGIKVGLLDYRPANKGSYGKFKITKWKMIK